MKASLKFRDEKQPLVRAKIPLSILGLPFLSGISAGESKELRLDLGTAFESGPSFRICYRPNDSCKPFSVIVKTGAGSLGSPNSASMTMSAEFGLCGRGSPSFTIQIKPQLGDFFLRRSATSTTGSLPSFFPTGGGDDIINGTGFCCKKPIGISMAIPSTSVSGICDLLSGAELTSQSVLPLRNRAAVKFRWGVRIPSEIRPTFMDYTEREDPFVRISRCKLPVLVMSKVSIEQVREQPDKKPGDLASVQNQIASLHEETGILRNALDDLRAELSGRSGGGGSGNKRSLPCADRSPPPSKNGRTYEAVGPSPPPLPTAATEPARRT